MNCQFVIEGDRAWCTACLQPIRFSPAVQRSCGNDAARIVRQCSGLPTPADSQPNPPPLAKRAVNVGKALVRRAKQRKTPCTDAQIAERTAICLTCELFRRDRPDSADGTCTHRACGCPVSPRRRLRNKAAWSSEDCPLGKWPKIEPLG